MRFVTLALIVGLTGCMEPGQTTATSAATQPAAGAQSAYFPAYPAHLFDAAALACNDPRQQVVRPNRNEVRCESLPDPESAAAIILQFNGTVEDLPKIVIAFTGQNVANGYVVTTDSYIRVPQRTGGLQQVRFPDPLTGSKMEEVLEAAGGRLL